MTQSHKISTYQKPSLGLQKTPHCRHPSERLGMVSQVYRLNTTVASHTLRQAPKSVTNPFQPELHSCYSDSHKRNRLSYYACTTPSFQTFTSSEPTMEPADHICHLKVRWRSKLKASLGCIVNSRLVYTMPPCNIFLYHRKQRF